PVRVAGGALDRAVAHGRAPALAGDVAPDRARRAPDAAARAARPRGGGARGAEARHGGAGREALRGPGRAARSMTLASGGALRHSERALPVGGGRASATPDRGPRRAAARGGRGGRARGAAPSPRLVV